MKILIAIFCVFFVDFAVSHYNSAEREHVEDKEDNSGSDHHNENQPDLNEKTHKTSHVSEFHLNASLEQQPNQKCIELNQQREDLASCCNYPRIHFFRIYNNHCVDECIGTKDICCPMLCVWRNTKVKFEDGKVNLDGLKETLLQSVHHKDEWKILISRAVDQCNIGGIF